MLIVVFIIDCMSSLHEFIIVGNLYCLQARPIATLPPTCFLDLSVIGCVPTLWDNSNIVESYSGVTTPLTFSFASNAYSRVSHIYRIYCMLFGGIQ